MADVRDTEAKFKSSLFEALILFQPSLPLIAFEQYVLHEFEDKFFQQGENVGGLVFISRVFRQEPKSKTSLDIKIHHATISDCT